MSAGTTRRTVRIDDDLWDAARTVADESGDNLSEVLREALIDYAQGISLGKHNALVAILELTENATTVHGRLALRDCIRAVVETRLSA